MVSIINTSKSSGPYFAQNALNLVTIMFFHTHVVRGRKNVLSCDYGGSG